MPGRQGFAGKSGDTGDGYTGLDLITFAAILILAGALIVHLATGLFLPSSEEGGIIPAALKPDADQLNVFGSITGFSATTGSSGGIPVVRSNPDPNRLGAVGMTLSLFLGGTHGVDLAQTNVTWTDSAGIGIIYLTKETPLVCPNWTITNKYNINPFKSADEDMVLEPGEQFDVFICPADTLPPYEEFVIVFDPPGSGYRFPVKCAVPFQVTQVMTL